MNFSQINNFRFFFFIFYIYIHYKNKGPSNFKHEHRYVQLFIWRVVSIKSLKSPNKQRSYPPELFNFCSKCRNISFLALFYVPQNCLNTTWDVPKIRFSSIKKIENRLKIDRFIQFLLIYEEKKLKNKIIDNPIS